MIKLGTGLNQASETVDPKNIADASNSHLGTSDSVNGPLRVKAHVYDAHNEAFTHIINACRRYAIK